MKKFLYMMAAMFICFVPMNDSAASNARGTIDNREIIDPDNIDKQVKYGDYEITVYRDNEAAISSALQILKDGAPVFEDEEYVFEIGLISEDIEGNEYIDKVQDITGNGIPNVVISSWSGGMHCCFEYRVFELGEEFGVLDMISADDAGNSHFKDLNNDGSLEFISRDFTYAYWNTSFAGSPAPKIVLKYEEGRYVLAPELMEEPLEEASRYQELRERFQFAYDALEKEGTCHGWSRDGNCILPDVWSHMLYLIYAGHKEEAWKFLDDHWPYSENDKQWFVYDLKGKLAASWYYPAMKDELFGYGSIAVDRHQEYMNNVLKYLEEKDSDKSAAEK